MHPFSLMDGWTFLSGVETFDQSDPSFKSVSPAKFLIKLQSLWINGERCSIQGSLGYSGEFLS